MNIPQQPPETSSNSTRADIVIGASGGIANALLLRLLDDDSVEQLIGISRKPCPEALAGQSKLKWIVIDYTEDNIKDTIQTLRDDSKTAAVVFRHVFICHGILHGSPESDFYGQPFG
ncbi:MAG: hypothetical protein P8O99_01285, partial [Pseudomonadales bacterium]|nr:hypothetical protein [Pseudomonadales bacterium]